VGLFDGIGLPLLAILLILDHILQVLFKGLSKLPVCVEWRIAATINLCILVVNIHATSAWKVTITNDESLRNNKKKSNC